MVDTKKNVNKTCIDSDLAVTMWTKFKFIKTGSHTALLLKLVTDVSVLHNNMILIQNINAYCNVVICHARQKMVSCLQQQVRGPGFAVVFGYLDIV
jgi:hypothetical protein